MVNAGLGLNLFAGLKGRAPPADTSPQFFSQSPKAPKCVLCITVKHPEVTLSPQLRAYKCPPCTYRALVG